MRSQEEFPLRAIILQSQSRFSDRSPAGRLLSDLGHSVQTVHSPADAMIMLATGNSDLMVVDLADAENREEFLGNLGSLPASQQPRHVTVFTDTIDESVQSLRKRLPGSRIHIFVKPLHMHGLLSVLRAMDQSHAVSA